MTETNPLSCRLETECRQVQFWAFLFWSFDIAPRLPVVKTNLYNRLLRVVSPSTLLRTVSLSNGLSNHFGFRDSDF